ncbi:MAG: hypothetical protein M3O46_01925 [Myxococcota bacterium]|nr:hypothetical protein [Myxococcota bacterium]
MRSAPHFVVCSLFALALAKVRAQSGQQSAMYSGWTFAQSADSIWS